MKTGLGFAKRRFFCGECRSVLPPTNLVDSLLQKIPDGGNLPVVKFSTFILAGQGGREKRFSGPVSVRQRTACGKGERNEI
jgi:hypothetical protein